MLLISSLCINKSYAQLTSNKGTDFWVAYAGHIDGTKSKMTLFLSAEVTTTYSVTALGQVLFSGTIAANNVAKVIIDPVLYGVHIFGSDVKETNMGINVVTDKPISLYSVIANKARTGGSLILPTSALAQEYYVFSEKGLKANSAGYSQFTVIGVKDNTTVEIIPTSKSYASNREAGVPFNVVLNKGDVYQYQSEDDLTGTSVRSLDGCLPIAVFSGSTWTAYCEEENSTRGASGDNLFQQMFPVSAWGRNFVSAPFYNTQNGNKDIIKIIVSEDNTVLTINGSTSSVNGKILKATYGKGEIVFFSTNAPAVISANKPIAVAQFQTSQNCNLNNAVTVKFPGDPEMTVLNPIEQTLKDITVYSKLENVETVIKNYYINIMLKSADVNNFTIDGSKIASSFITIPNSDYSYATVNVTNSPLSQHRMICNGGFSAIVYGYGIHESYAYLAGTDLKNLNSSISVFKDGGTLAATALCLGSNYSFELRLAYLTEKITWVLNDGTPEVVHNPSFTTIVENAQTFYLYNYTTASGSLQNPGAYNLKAIVKKPSSAACLNDDIVLTSFDVFAPVISAPEKACVNTGLNFKDMSPTTGGPINSWLWDFGDGNTSTLQNASFTFTTPGTKVVKLTVRTDLGCELTTTHNIEIEERPRSKFEVTGTYCENAVMSFENKSTFVNSDIVGQTWDFGDGSLGSTEKSPTHSYAQAGPYKVTLVSTSSSGCTDTSVANIIINPIPKISFKDPESCVNDQVQFEAVTELGTIEDWLWDFGDATDNPNKNLEKPKHRYTASGNYLVKLIGTTAAGCQAVFEKQITISGANPQAVFEVLTENKLCATDSVLFKNNSAIPFGNITKIEWIFDYEAGRDNVVDVDNSPALGKVYAHKYPNSTVTKEYFVVMRAYSGQACFNESAPYKITVHPLTSLKFNAIAQVCESVEDIQLTAVDENSVGGEFLFSGRGVSSSGVFSPRSVGAGVYTITCLYTSVGGCAEQKSIEITVGRMPLVNMSDDIDILANGSANINNTAYGDDLQFKWSPSEGLSRDDILNPIASPLKTTNYVLTITSNTCVLERMLKVVVHPEVIVSNAFSPNGDGINDTWVIKHLNSYRDAKVTVYNRYGTQLYYSSPYLNPWDGKVKGEDVPIGVYYYIIESAIAGKRYTGSLTIIR